MAVRGIGMVTSITRDTAPNFKASIHVISADTTTAVETDVNLTGIAPTILASGLSQALKNAIKQCLEDNGVTFGLLDEVRLIGGDLV